MIVVAPDATDVVAVVAADVAPVLLPVCVESMSVFFSIARLCYGPKIKHMSIKRQTFDICLIFFKHVSNI